MAKMRSFGGVTAAIWECVKASSEKEHETKYEPRDGVQGTATTRTLVGQIVLEFSYDRAKETLNYTISKKPLVVTDNQVWDGGTGLASLTLTVTAPLVGLRLAGDPSRSTVEPGNGAYLGDVGGHAFLLTEDRPRSSISGADRAHLGEIGPDSCDGIAEAGLIAMVDPTRQSVQVSPQACSL